MGRGKEGGNIKTATFGGQNHPKSADFSFVFVLLGLLTNVSNCLLVCIVSNVRR